jgi:conjugative transfer region protein TrbK
MTEQEQPSRRFVLPGWRTLAIGAAVAGTGVVALVALHEPAPPTSRLAVSVGEENVLARATSDPLMAELLRCRSLPAGTDDAACREAWEVNRRRFMGESRAYIPPATANDTGER